MSTFVVVGGDAAGMSAAGKARREDPELDVVVLERGEWVSYGACGIPYFVKGEIAEVEDLVVRSPERIVERQGIDLRRGHAVVGVDPGEGTVTVEPGHTGADYPGRAGGFPGGESRANPDERYELAYDDLLLATGGRAVVPDVSGTDLAGVFTIRSLDAGRALRNYLTPEEASAVSAVESGFGAELRAYLTEHVPESVAVVGGNKIGLEIAEAFVARGLDVHLIEPGEHVFGSREGVLPSFGDAAAEWVEEQLREQGVELHLGTPIRRFEGEDGHLTAVVTGAGRVPVDAVLLDVGVEPRVDLAEEVGLERGSTGGIAVDEFGRTSQPGIYAAGDCAEKRHAITGAPTHLPLALPANRAGRAVGTTVATGDPTPVGEVLGTVVSKIFDLEVARTGILDHELAGEAGFAPVTETITTISRAHYYPGWARIVVELTADAESGRLLGGALVGPDGAAHRVNSVAVALHCGATVEELAGMEFGYSPPFSPVWDPVLTAAKALSGDVE